MTVWADVIAGDLVGTISQVLGTPPPASPAPENPVPGPPVVPRDALPPPNGWPGLLVPPGISGGTPHPPDPRVTLSDDQRAALQYMGIDPDTASIADINKALTGMGEMPLPTISAPEHSPTAPPPGTAPVTPTGETSPQRGPVADSELSGEAAEVVERLDEALAHNRTALNEADEQLVDALLKARDSSEQGRARLEELQQSIIEQVQKLGPTLDTPAGQQQLASFLQGKAGEINEVLQSEGLDSASHGAVLDGLTARYEALADKESPPGEQNRPGGAGTTQVGAGGGTGSGPAGAGEAGTGGAGLADDPLLNGLASDPFLAGLGSMLGPGMGALGQLPGTLGGMMPFGGGGAMGGGLPLGDIGSGIGSAIRDAKAAGDREPPDPLTDPAIQDKPQARGEEDRSELKDPPVAAAGPQDSATTTAPHAQSGQLTPAAAEQPAADDLTVKLPGLEDPVKVENAAVAAAGRAVVSGTPIEQAYREANLTLSPPGAPVTTNAVSQSRLVFGDVGQFTDHRIMAVDRDNAWVNGKVTPLEDVEFGTTFLGWERPQAPAPAAPVVSTSASTTPPTEK